MYYSLGWDCSYPGLPLLLRNKSAELSSFSPVNEQTSEQDGENVSAVQHVTTGIQFKAN